MLGACRSISMDLSNYFVRMLLVAFVSSSSVLGAEVGTQTNASWTKYGGNPVIGGNYGTCFDVAVLKDGERYRMWLSWRPQKSIALVESSDGLHWSEPPRVVLGPREQTGWETEVNRPVVIKRGQVYSMWY